MNCRKSKKSLIWCIFGIVLIIVLLVVSIWGVKSYSKHKISEQVQAIEDAYLEGNYDVALELAYKLPDKYQQYYTSFFLRAKEIDDWSGTCSELIEWLDVFFEEFESFELRETSMPEEYHWHYGYYINNAKEMFSEKEEFIEMLDWYPMLKEYEVACFSAYDNLLSDNQKLLSTPSNNGILAISIAQIKDNDERSENWYVYYKNKVAEMKKSYNSELMTEYVYSFISKMENCYESYPDCSLSHLYDISDKEGYLYITEGMVDSIRVQMNIAMTIAKIGYYWISADSWGESLESHGELSDYYYSHNDIAQELLAIIYTVFNAVTPEITDGIDLTIEEAIKESVSSVDN